ncbi:MAG: recombinase family protein [Firmicutes bacterium]|nr:recombinase family protein [Bacillota bacterium]
MKKKCYFYTRVSTAAQIEGYSLEAQQETLRQYAEYWEWEVAGEYCDAGKSGKSIKGRPAFQRMLDDIVDQKDNISFVLVFKLSRFGRNAADVLKSMQTLMDYGVDLVCVDDAIDSSTAGGRLTMTILSAVAEIERENINVQFQAGRMQKVLDGGWPGGPTPYGYRNEKKSLVIEPEEAEMVRRIYDLFLQDGMNTTAVAIYLNEHGYRRSSKEDCGPFTYDFVSRVLKNPVYCGRIMFNRRSNCKPSGGTPKEVMCVRGKQEALVTEERWEAAQRKREQLSVPRGKVDDPERISLLTGLIKCPKCGAGMVMRKNKKANKNHGGYYKILYSYGCVNYRKANGRTCDYNTIYHQERTDNAVFEIVSGLTMLPEFRTAVMEQLGDQGSAEAIEEKLKELRKQLRKEERQKRKLGEDLDNLDILDESYDKKYDRIQAKIEKIYDRMDAVELELERTSKRLSALKQGIRAADNVMALLDHMKRLYGHMTCEEKREMYRLIIDRIEVFPRNEEGKIVKSISFKFPVLYGELEAVPMKKADEYVEFFLDCSGQALTAAEAKAKATYAQIKAYVLEKSGLKVSALYIAQTKRKYGLDMGVNYNKPADPDVRVPHCPKVKEELIVDALKHFKVLPETAEVKQEEGGEKSGE